MPGMGKRERPGKEPCPYCKGNKYLAERLCRGHTARDITFLASFLRAPSVCGLGRVWVGFMGLCLSTRLTKSSTDGWGGVKRQSTNKGKAYAALRAGEPAPFDVWRRVVTGVEDGMARPGLRVLFKGRWVFMDHSGLSQVLRGSSFRR